MRPAPLGLAALAAASVAAGLASAQPAYSGEDVADRPTRMEEVARLRRHLRDSGLGGRIASCSMMVQVFHHARNRVIGSICSVRTGAGTRNLLMCTDDAIGHFALTITFAHDREEVTRFAYQNCGGWTNPGMPDPGNTS